MKCTLIGIKNISNRIIIILSSHAILGDVGHLYDGSNPI